MKTTSESGLVCVCGLFRCWILSGWFGFWWVNRVLSPKWTFASGHSVGTVATATEQEPLLATGSESVMDSWKQTTDTSGYCDLLSFTTNRSNLLWGILNRVVKNLHLHVLVGSNPGCDGCPFSRSFCWVQWLSFLAMCQWCALKFTCSSGLSTWLATKKRQKVWQLYTTVISLSLISLLCNVFPPHISF